MTEAAPPDPWRDPSLSAAQRADALLAALTLEERAAQLGSIWIQDDAAAESGGVAPMDEAFSPRAVDIHRALAHGLGQITRPYGTAPVTVPDGAAQLRDLQARVVATQRLGVPAMVHEECLTGVAAWGATAFPTPLAWASAFDPALVERMARLIGEDLRALGVHQGLAPVLDVVRDYRWGRVEETLGEDPLLVGTLGAAYVRGLEGAGVVATLKHFAAYSGSRGARNHAPVSVGRRELAEVYLPPFEQALIEGGARSVMNSYTDVDGVPAGVDHELLTEILRDRWGFTGTVVSDYWAIPFLHSMHAVASSDEGAGELALAAGIDVELPETIGFAGLAQAARQRRVAEGRLAEAALRVLRQKVEVGLLDAPAVPAAAAERDLDSPEHREIARLLAERSITLLANDGTLPLDPTNPRRIALIGPAADSRECLLGCYSFPNHVLRRLEQADFGFDMQTVEQAVRAEFPDATVVAHAGTAFDDDATEGIDAAVDVARDADLAVLVLGDISGLFGRGTSGEGCDVADLRLPGQQAALAEAVLASGTPTVLIVISGRPYAIGALAEQAVATVQAFLPGAEGAGAIAGVLSGRVDPNGRLPVQIPGTPHAGSSTYLQPRLGARVDGTTVLDPTAAFAFGHGLAFHRPVLGSARTDVDDIPTDGAARVTVSLRGTTTESTEVVQLYVEHVTSMRVTPRRRLIGFHRITLGANEDAEIEFTIPSEVLSYISAGGERVVVPGDVILHVGRSADDLPFALPVSLTGTIRVVPDRRKFGAQAAVQILGT